MQHPPVDSQRVHAIARLVAGNIENGNLSAAAEMIRDDPDPAAVAVLSLRYSGYPTPGDNDRLLRLLGVDESVWGWYVDGDD